VDVRGIAETELKKTVGSLAAWLKRLSHGDDPREVKPDRPWKSISAETTYPEDLERPEEMRAEVERLARRVAASLEKKKLYARAVTLKLRYSDFTTVTRSHTAGTPTRAPAEFALRALALLERTDAARRPVRLLGVGAHGLAGKEALHPEQLLLE
jgi:DNA polymerase-4